MIDDLAPHLLRLEHLDEVAESTEPVRRRGDVLERQHDAAPSVFVLGAGASRCAAAHGIPEYLREDAGAPAATPAR